MISRYDNTFVITTGWQKKKEIIYESKLRINIWYDNLAKWDTKNINWI